MAGTSLLTTLEHAGFDGISAEIYLILVQNGEMSVPNILEYTNLSRASVYEALSELLVHDFVEYRKEGRNAYYTPAHPNRLFGLIEEKKRNFALLEEEMKQTIQTLTGTYNLVISKPGLRFFEGRDGFKEALDDTLTSQEPIYTFVNLDDVEKYVDDINKTYVSQRRAKGVEKRLLLLDTPGNREYIKKQGGSLSDTRFLPKEVVPFKTGMQIYDGKISYFTLRKDNLIAVIIEDKDIYQMNRNLFEYLWSISHVQ